MRHVSRTHHPPLRLLPEAIVGERTLSLTSQDPFTEFYREYYPWLLGMLRAAGYSRQEAEDAAAEVMLDAFRRWRAVTTNRRAWVRTAVKRTARRHADQLRNLSQRVRESAIDLAAKTGTEPYSEIDGNDVVVRLLAQLPQRQRLVLTLHLAGYEDHEISQHLSMTRETVRSTRRHAYLKLRKLAGHDLDGRRRA